MQADRSEYFKAYNHKYHKDNKEQISARHSAWRSENKEKRNAYARDWHSKNKAKDPESYAQKVRRHRLKRRYGISLEDYNDMLHRQGGHCALCESTPDQERFKTLCVDHCHDTGRVRGLLCNNHNLAIGKLGDSSEKIIEVLKYLGGI